MFEDEEQCQKKIKEIRKQSNTSRIVQLLLINQQSEKICFPGFCQLLYQIQRREHYCKRQVTASFIPTFFLVWLLFNSQATFSSFKLFLPRQLPNCIVEETCPPLIGKNLERKLSVYESWHLSHCTTHKQQNPPAEKFHNNSLPGEQLQSEALCSFTEM